MPKIYFFLIITFILSCNRGPKIITAPVETTDPQSSSGIFDNSILVPTTSSLETMDEGYHTVLVNEILPTEKYVYLNVAENDETFWLATRKQDVELGETYYYKGGLLKTNFESKEYGRVFEKIYLVSNIVKNNHGHNHPVDSESPIETNSTKVTSENRNITVEGSIKIADLVSNPAKYEGRQIQLSGECVKINPNIMGRHWIHLKDGSKDDYDLVITSDNIVPEGHIITISGVVTLNKDFGAGYKYDIIVENGKLLNL